MKTIEERAMEYSQSSYPTQKDMQFACEMHFEAGAEWMRKELTRWHDPKEEPPEGKEVLCMTGRRSHTYEVLRYDKHGWWMRVHIPESGWCACDCNVIGWREIHE